MLSAKFFEAAGLLTGCTVRGHADYTARDRRGQILCAAVSSAAELTCNTLTEILGVPLRVDSAPGEGEENFLSFALLAPDAQQSRLLEGLRLHLRNLAEDYEGMLQVETVSRESRQGGSKR